MYHHLRYLITWFLVFDHIYQTIANENDDDHKHRFLNVWAVKIDGDIQQAKELAQRYGFDFVEKFDGLDNVYILKKKGLKHRMLRQTIEHRDQLINDSAVLWIEQQETMVRVKRSDFEDNLVSKSVRNLWDSTRQFFFTIGANQNPTRHRFNDELWPHQWYLHSSGFSRFDHGIAKVWEMGITGRGIVVTILDDGLEWNHADLSANYDPNASYDMNDDDPDPSPRYDMFNSNAHGTRCAGVVAMTPQNQKCGVGAAFRAKIGGIRLLDGEVSDLVEARSLLFRNDYVDIYSASWGPNDDGMTVDGPKLLAQAALQAGITYGRRGKGCIYIWASGNGGSRGDNCNCDGYVSSIYTISINSVSESGRFPWYAEKCSSTIAVAFSSGAYNDQKIATTDIHNSCTREHSGTSAAAPLAASIIALVLEANYNLTWRDVQHLIVCTSEFSPLLEERGWRKNGVGFLYNSRFGFGLLMAESLVKAARNWETVPPKKICVIKNINFVAKLIADGGMIKLNLNNLNQAACPIRYLEHVQVRLTLETNKRGNTRIFMFSPKGSI
ncbi:hypothetical protein NH340_JMT01375 [Sarcoptes scabiei]|nr:hypothetical protein NH340_JMT01375 [Sarcoptes scabiei]